MRYSWLVGAVASLATVVPAEPRAEQALEPYFQDPPWRAAAARFRAGEWAAASDAFQAALAGRSGDTEERLRGRLLLAIAQASAGRFAMCAATAEKLVRDDRLLAAHAAYQAARCHLRAGAPERALALAAGVPDDSVPAAESELVAALALARLGRWGEALRRAERHLERFPEGPGRAEAMATAAEAADKLGRPHAALARWRELWSTSSSETWSRRADERLTMARVTRSSGEWVGRGMVLFDRHDNVAAERAFSEALRAPGLTPTLACRARYHLAQSVWKARQRARAEPLFAAAVTVCREARDADLTTRALYQRGRCLDYTGAHTDATAVFGEIEKDHAGHSYADDACLRAAEVAAEEDDLDGADRLLAALPDRYPDGDMVGEALWRRVLRALGERRFPDARALLEENLRRVPRATIWYAEGRAEYWLGRVHQDEGELAAAGRRYEEAIRRYPLSVYAWQAFERLGEIAPAQRQRLLAELRSGRLPAEPAPGPLNLAGLARERGWQRGVALARAGLGAEAHRELARLRVPEARPPSDGKAAAAAERVGASVDERLPWATALVLHRAGLWNTSHALVASQLVGFRLTYPSPTGPGHWQVAYPRAYNTLVQRAAAEHRFPAPLQHAIMREESAFSARAVSTAGCLGLTMMKPSTAEAHLRRKVRREELFDPATNVALGGQEMRKLLDRYDGSVASVIAAYNAGPGAVDRWRKEFAGMPLDMFLERIPYDETRGYTKRVLASYFAYAWLYDPSAPVPSAEIR